MQSAWIVTKRILRTSSLKNLFTTRSTDCKSIGFHQLFLNDFFRFRPFISVLDPLLLLICLLMCESHKICPVHLWLKSRSVDFYWPRSKCYGMRKVGKPLHCCQKILSRERKRGREGKTGPILNEYSPRSRVCSVLFSSSLSLPSLLVQTVESHSAGLLGSNPGSPSHPPTRLLSRTLHTRLTRTHESTWRIEKEGFCTLLTLLPSPSHYTFCKTRERKWTEDSCKESPGFIKITLETCTLNTTERCWQLLFFILHLSSRGS